MPVVLVIFVRAPPSRAGAKPVPYAGTELALSSQQGAGQLVQGSGDEGGDVGYAGAEANGDGRLFGLI